MQKFSKPILAAAAFVFVGGVLLFVWARRSNNPANILAEAYQKTAECRQEGKITYPVNWTDDLQVPSAGMQDYEDCIENSNKHSEFQGLDLKSIDVEILCRCKNVFLPKLRKEIDSGASSGCTPFQAMDSIEEQCRDVAKKAKR